MASEREIRKEQKRSLYQLKMLERNNSGIEVKGLHQLINQQEAEMDAEDVAWVEKKITQLKG